MAARFKIVGGPGSGDFGLALVNQTLREEHPPFFKFVWEAGEILLDKFGNFQPEVDNPISLKVKLCSLERNGDERYEGSYEWDFTGSLTGPDKRIFVCGQYSPTRRDGWAVLEEPGVLSKREFCQMAQRLTSLLTANSELRERYSSTLEDGGQLIRDTIKACGWTTEQYEQMRDDGLV